MEKEANKEITCENELDLDFESPPLTSIPTSIPTPKPTPNEVINLDDDETSGNECDEYEIKTTISPDGIELFAI